MIILLNSSICLTSNNAGITEVYIMIRILSKTISKFKNNFEGLWNFQIMEKLRNMWPNLCNSYERQSYYFWNFQWWGSILELIFGNSPIFTNIPYRTKIHRTKFSTDKIFRRTKFSTSSRNFDSFVRFLPDFCIEILDKIFDGQNVSSDKIFDTKLKFWHFCPTNFCPIRYIYLNLAD